MGGTVSIRSGQQLGEKQHQRVPDTVEDAALVDTLERYQRRLEQRLAIERDHHLANRLIGGDRRLRVFLDIHRRLDTLALAARESQRDVLADTKLDGVAGTAPD